MRTFVLAAAASAALASPWRTHVPAPVKGSPPLHPARAATAKAGKPEYYVDCDDGSDSAGDGSASAPWKTLYKAQLAVRQGPPAVVYVGGFCYPTNPATGAIDWTQSVLNLSSADSSGDPNNLNEWTTMQNKQGYLLGGMPIPASAWAPAGGSYPAGVMVASLPAGYTPGSLAAGGLGTCEHTMPELFYGNQTLVQARYPNVNPSTGIWQWMNIDRVLNASAFTVLDTRPLTWANQVGAGGQADSSGWAHGYWSFDWADSYVRIASVTPWSNATASGTLITVEGDTPPLYGFLPKARWYGTNLPSELDAPGEYFFDDAANKVYFYPPGPIDDSNADTTIWLTMAQYVVSGPDVAEAGGVNGHAGPRRGKYMSGHPDSKPKGVSLLPDSGALTNVILNNLVVLYARNTGISLPNVNNVNISFTTSAYHTRHAAELIGFASGFIGGYAGHTGCAAITVTGGSSSTLAPGEMSVNQNVLSDYARITRTYNPGVGWFGCVRCGLSYNLISDAPHNGMLGGGNDNLFMGNTFKNLCYEATDSGAWYAGRSWIERGNTIVNNTFVNIFNREKMTLGWPQVQAVYLDDQLSGTVISGNTFTDCDTGIVIGGGRDVQVLDNTFVNCSLPVSMDARGLGWQAASCAFNASYTGDLVQGLFSVNYTQPPYATEYPEIVKTLQYHPCTPVNVTIINNQYCNTTGSNPFISATANQTTSWLDKVSNNQPFNC